MACEILVVAVGKPPWTTKGQPWVIKDAPCVWGTSECPPNWVIIHIVDATRAQCLHYIQKWKKEFSYTIVNENAFGYRIRIEVNSALVSVSGLNKEVRQEVKDYIYTKFGGSLVDHGADYAIFDVPKPIDLPQAKVDLNDKFATIFSLRRWYFSSADIDTVLAAGGYMELTKKQVLNRVLDRLDD